MMSEPAQPIVGRAKSLLDQLLRIGQTRLELLSAEVHREKLALLRQWQLAVTAVVCACLAGVTLITWIAIALPPEYRTIVLGILFFALLAGAGVCWLAIRARARRAPVFSRVIHQLKLDRASLGSAGGHSLGERP
jgi:uncharacterized membrane protein YqjE